MARCLITGHQGYIGSHLIDIGTGNPTSLNYIKEYIRSKKHVGFNLAPPRPGDVQTTRADCIRASAWGFKPIIKIEDGLKECFG